FLKIHPGLSRESFDAIAAEAKRRGIRFAGHVPTDVGLERAIEARYWSIDHIDGFLEAMVRPGAPVNAKEPGFFGLDLVLHVGESKLPALVAKTKAAGVWVVPTENVMELFAGSESTESLARGPGVAYIPAPIVEQWRRQHQGFRADPGLTEAK